MAERRTTCGLLGLWLALAMSAGFGSSLAFAQEQHEASTSDLAKAAQNPIADMISVPFQNNFNFHVGPHNQLQDILNIQPVIPITLDRDWNLITRWITPVISQPPLTVTGDREFGLGDINPSFFFSPKQPTHGIIWGIGPTFVFPTGTDKTLTQGKYSVGPTFVALTIQGPWVLGVLVNNVWSFAGKSNRGPVNQMMLAALRELQPARRLVPDVVADHHRRLGSRRRRPLDRAGRRRLRARVQDRPASRSICSSRPTTTSQGPPGAPTGSSGPRCNSCSRNRRSRWARPS